MKEMTRLKDHVDYQLDLRAPFTFMFNHISQDPAAQPPAADLEAPTFVQEEAEYAELAGDPSFIQEEAEYAELTGNDSPWGQLHCIREGEGEPIPPQPDPGEGDPGPLDAQTHVDPVLGAEEQAAGRSDQPPPAAVPPPSARASRPPRRGFSSPFTTSFMASLLGLIALTASVDGLASPPASFNTSEPSGTPQLGEWSALPGVPPVDPSSHLRLEVIVAILIAPLILKLAAWIPRGVEKDREQPNPDSEAEGDTSDPPPHGPGNPSTPFLPLDWLKKGAGADSCLLNVYRHRGYEIAAMQQADPTCVAFINHAFPSHARALPTSPSLRVDPGELAAMITRKGKYRIIRTANVKSWSLLTYGSGRQVYAPAECRLLLLAAAHAAAMAGMGAPCHLLKKAFYWPSLDEDARKYAWTSKIQRRRRSGRKQRAPQPRDGGAVTADASTRSHGPTKLPASARGPPAGRPRVKRGSPALRGVEPRPDAAHEERSQAAHPHYQPAPMAELMPFPARQSLFRISALSTPAEAACLREFGYRDPTSPLEEATSGEPRMRGPRTCPHAPPQGEGNDEPPHLQRYRSCHHAPPPGEGDLLRLQQRFHRLTETMRRATERLRALEHMREMMARQKAPDQDEGDQDQAYPDQTLRDQAVLDHVREMMARQSATSVDMENPDQAPLDWTPSDQAGLIAEGDVPKQEQNGCGLPDARPRPCPH